MFRAVSRSVAFQNIPLKKFHSAAILRLREIVEEKKDDKTTVIDCKYVPSPRTPHLLKVDKKGDKCPLCRLKLDLKYTDVLILCQYIDSQGNIMRHKDTNLCRDQYKLVKELIYMAQYAGLLPEPPSDEPKKPYRLLNTYYDERTIRLRPKFWLKDPRFEYLKRNLSPLEKFRVKPDLGVHNVLRKK